MDRLIVKNFGPLKDIDIELNKINLFIGENGSGKSVLAKLIIALRDISIARNEYSKEFFYHLEKLEIKRFLRPNTQIKYILKSEEIVNIFGKNIKINDDNLFLKNIEKERKKYHSPYPIPFTEVIKKVHTIDYPKIYKYIPAERNILSILNESINSLVRYKVPLPDFLLDFASEYEYARKEIKELEVLNVKYQFDGTDKIYYDKDNYLKLSHSSSGIQSAIPMLLTAKYFAKKYRGIVIEEPEQNLFPKAQKEVVEFIIAQLSNDSSLFLMTHSPYILTSLNNLILANDVLQQKGEDAIKGIIDKKSCVAFKDISAYSIENGKAINIMDNENRLIGVNIIDSISEEIDETFDKLLGKLDI